MTTFVLNGPYVLTAHNINVAITKRSPGVYALGPAQNNTLFVHRVGRSDGDLAQRLMSHLNKYSSFMYSYCVSQKAAFEAECDLYHDFNPPDNAIHPDRPNGSGWKCPRCRVFG
jgi:hypothetical protein